MTVQPAYARQLYVDNCPADANDTFATLAPGHVLMTIARPIWLWYGRDAPEGGWTVGVAVMPRYGRRVMWVAVGLIPIAVARAAPHTPTLARRSATAPRIPLTLTWNTVPAQPPPPAPLRNDGGGDVDAPRTRSPSPAAHPVGYATDDVPTEPVWPTQTRRNLVLARRGRHTR